MARRPGSQVLSIDTRRTCADIEIFVQELQLPKSIITRLAKGVLPPNTQIQANAILAMTKSATVFINHLANAYVSPLTQSRIHRGANNYISPLQGQRGYDTPKQEDRYARRCFQGVG